MIKSNFGQLTRFPGLFFKNRSFLSYSSWSTETKHVSVYSQVFFAQDVHFSHFRVIRATGLRKYFIKIQIFFASELGSKDISLNSILVLIPGPPWSWKPSTKVSNESSQNYSFQKINTNDHFTGIANNAALEVNLHNFVFIFLKSIFK